jgi:hypothetical protein
MVTTDRRPQGAPSWLPRFTHRFIAVHDPAPFMPRLAALAERNATPNTSPSKTCPPRSASRMPRPPGTAGSQARPAYLVAMAPSILLSIGFFLLSHRAVAV